MHAGRYFTDNTQLSIHLTRYNIHANIFMIFIYEAHLDMYTMQGCTRSVGSVSQITGTPVRSVRYRTNYNLNVCVTILFRARLCACIIPVTSRRPCIFLCIYKYLKASGRQGWTFVFCDRSLLAANGCCLPMSLSY